MIELDWIKNNKTESEVIENYIKKKSEYLLASVETAMLQLEINWLVTHHYNVGCNYLLIQFQVKNFTLLIVIKSGTAALIATSS